MAAAKRAKSAKPRAERGREMPDAVRAWLNKHNGQCLWQQKFGQPPGPGREIDTRSLIETWAVNGRVVVFQFHAIGGWDLYTPCDSNDVAKTLADAEARIGLTPKALEAPKAIKLSAPKLAAGWHTAAAFGQHSVLIEIAADGLPLRVRTTLYDLDGALDHAAQFYGEPLEITRTWQTDNGEDVELRHGHNCRVTCEVARAHDVHEGDDGLNNPTAPPVEKP
jgi:hypothetical protein